MDGLAIAASLREAEHVVQGASIRGIFEPERGTFVVHLFARGNLRLLVSPADSAIHLTELDLANPARPSPFVMLLRKHLRGGRIVGVQQQGWERVVAVEVERRREEGLERLSLVAELLGLRGNLVLVEEGRVLGSFRQDPRAKRGSIYQPLAGQGKLDPSRLTPADLAPVSGGAEGARGLVRLVDAMGKETAQAVLSLAEQAGGESSAERLCQAVRSVVDRVRDPKPQYDPATWFAAFFALMPPGEPLARFSLALDRAFAARHAAQEETVEVGAIRSGLLRAAARRERTLAQLGAWLEAAERAPSLQRQGDLLLTHRDAVRPRSREALLTDPTSGQVVPVPLDPSKSPIENAQALYERAKKLRRGRPIVERRRARLKRELGLLQESLSRIERGGEPSAEAIALIPQSRARPRQAIPTSPRICQVLGYTVQVGKSAAQNDALLRAARPDDLWLHAKDVAGSHVIVRQKDRGPIPSEVVREAARLAARFSKAKDERRVEVAVTPVKYVRKPAGARPGLVIVTREDTLTVDPQAGGEAG